MNIQAMKQGAIVGGFLGFLGFPMLTIGVLFYHLFQSKTNDALLFNSLAFEMEGSSAFTFQIKPNFFIYMIVIFAASFLIVAFLSAMKQQKAKD
ncbi:MULTISPECIES: hypothetical protein [unclassified Bacillus (in: firmicutes)]|uniref:hypothetical protein n=1 Tax=unclassified Bacillus (in: firmicutes) TaxID=185979 RepID=UPI000D0397C6|nr:MULTISPECIES: hypothetical protein [unclassified Bacillus (in: firmicutes)]PRR91853.1 hypothetical protein C6W21_00160 [Bacillus sp. NMCN1]PRR99484.1 hypothetical protein C6W20_00160 [Bacillus sp. NMCN6]